MQEAPRIVAICGTAPSTRDMINEQSPEVEIWALNDCYTFIAPEILSRQSTRWFEIHHPNIWNADGQAHVKFLQEFPGLVYMQAHYDEIPNSVRYPFEAIRDQFFPGLDLDNSENLSSLMLASTVDYMLALALYEGYDVIKMYGINMATNTEYVHQLPSCNFWMGMIRGSGRTLVIPEACPMLKAPIYGADRPKYITPEMLQTRKQRVMVQKQAEEAKLNAISGALQAFEILEGVLGEAKLAPLERDGQYNPPQIFDFNRGIGDVNFSGETLDAAEEQE